MSCGWIHWFYTCEQELQQDVEEYLAQLEDYEEDDEMKYENSLQKIKPSIGMSNNFIHITGSLRCVVMREDWHEERQFCYCLCDSRSFDQRSLPR